MSGCQANASAAVFNELGKTAALNDVRIENSIATGPCGAIGNSGTLALIRVSLSGNRATTAGGLFGTSSDGATLKNVAFAHKVKINKPPFGSSCERLWHS